MDLSEIQAAIGGPNPQSARPDGPSSVVPLEPLGLKRPDAEPFPADVSSAQGAGSPGNVLAPLTRGEATDGQVLTGGPNANVVPDGPPKATYSGFPLPEPGAGQNHAVGLD